MGEIYNKKKLLILNYIQNNKLKKKFVNVTFIMSKYSLNEYIIYEKHSFTLMSCDMYVKEHKLNFPTKTQMCEFIHVDKNKHYYNKKVLIIRLYKKNFFMPYFKPTITL